MNSETTLARTSQPRFLICPPRHFAVSYSINPLDGPAGVGGWRRGAAQRRRVRRMQRSHPTGVGSDSLEWAMHPAEKPTDTHSDQRGRIRLRLNCMSLPLFQRRSRVADSVCRCTESHPLRLRGSTSLKFRLASHPSDSRISQSLYPSSVRTEMSRHFPPNSSVQRPGRPNPISPRATSGSSRRSLAFSHRMPSFE
jgi:hypothetical protein